MYAHKILITIEHQIEENDNLKREMKRILTSILLLLVLTFSVHPILTLHFCGDDLKSLNIGVMSNDNMCCMPTEIGDNENAKLPVFKLIESENSCCTTTNVEVVTDNFISNSSQTIESPTDTSLMPGWFILNYLVSLTAPETTVKSNLNFPTQGFFIKTLDFLSLVCIYRL